MKVLVKKLKGTEYVYELESNNWIPELGQGRSKLRRIIGKIDPKAKKTDQIKAVLATKTSERVAVGIYDSLETNPEKKYTSIDKLKLKNHFRPLLKSNLGAEEQIEVFDLIMDPKHNCMFISGSGGSGKTTLLASTWLSMRIEGLKVMVMSYTGIAAYNANIRYRDIASQIKTLKKKKKISTPDAGTIHKKLHLKELKWFNTEDLASAINLTPRRKEKLRLKYHLADGIGDSALSIWALNEIIHNLSSIDVIMIDEASMVSSNLIDLILEFKEQADETRTKSQKKPIRLIMFGDFYQLKPVVDNSIDTSLEKAEESTKKKYEEKYNGRTELFNCPKVSKINEILFYELKENHRIEIGKNLSKKKREDNYNYMKSLEQIKTAGETLRRAFRDNNVNYEKDLLELDDAIRFLNKSTKPFAKYINSAAVRKQKDYPTIIAGRNKTRVRINNLVTERMIGNAPHGTVETEYETTPKTKDCLRVSGSSFDLIYKYLKIPQKYSFYVGMPIVFTKSAEAKESKGRCFNGRFGSISGVNFKDDSSTIESVTVSFSEEEKDIGPIFPERFQMYHRYLGEVVIMKMPFDPAFALTYHKVQGQSLDAVYIRTSRKNLLDSNSLYVGLSRGKNFATLGISHKIPTPLNDDKTLNARNTVELFSHYFKLGEINPYSDEGKKYPKDDKSLVEEMRKRVRNTNASSISFFLSDIKKEEPTKYKNWKYMCFGRPVIPSLNSREANQKEKPSYAGDQEIPF